MQTSGFEIHQWCSNHPESLIHLVSSQREDTFVRSINVNDTIRTLGLEWNPTADVFQFSVKQVEGANTKRQVLSAISKIFDPLGLMGPIITRTKLIMQETWRTSCSWDDPLPVSII